MNWIKELLFSKYVGNFLRHAFTALGALLVSKGIADAEQAQNLAAALSALVPGLLTWLIGFGASIAKTKTLEHEE